LQIWLSVPLLDGAVSAFDTRMTTPVPSLYVLLGWSVTCALLATVVFGTQAEYGKVAPPYAGSFWSSWTLSGTCVPSLA
jgi:hypothetical protein